MLRQPAVVVEKLPENRLRLRQGMVEKKILFSVGASRWEPRLAVLTEDAFLLSLTDMSACDRLAQVVEKHHGPRTN